MAATNERAKMVGQRIRALRERNEWTQEELAEKAKVGRSWLSLAETGGRQRPNGEYLERVARVLGSSVRYLMTGIEDDSPVLQQDLTALIAELEADIHRQYQANLTRLHRIRSLQFAGEAAGAASATP